VGLVFKMNRNVVSCDTLKAGLVSAKCRVLASPMPEDRFTLLLIIMALPQACPILSLWALVVGCFVLIAVGTGGRGKTRLLHSTHCKIYLLHA
jgi:hypothetical protein